MRRGTGRRRAGFWRCERRRAAGRAGANGRRSREQAGALTGRQPPPPMNPATAERLLGHPLLSYEAEIHLAERIQTGDEGAVHELVQGNLRLARFHAEAYARRFPSAVTDEDDLFSEAVAALYKAARKSQPALGRVWTVCDILFAHSRSRKRRPAPTTVGRRRWRRNGDLQTAGQAAWRRTERMGR